MFVEIAESIPNPNRTKEVPATIAHPIFSVPSFSVYFAGFVVLVCCFFLFHIFYVGDFHHKLLGLDVVKIPSPLPRSSKCVVRFRFIHATVGTFQLSSA